jgi:hypothetical protein
LLVVVEQGRLPFHAVVTLGAGRDSALRKLQAMNVRMACFALRRSCLEIRIDQPGFWSRWFMAADALGNSMSANQGEARSGMIEPGEFLPRLAGMASLALEPLSTCCRLPHELKESFLVWISVATCASQVLPVITRGWFRFEPGGGLMTITARDRHMTAAQSKGRFVMPARAECGWNKSLRSVTMLAAIEVGRGGKLSGMFIPVAVRALLKLHLVDRGFALGNVTLRTLQRGMPALKRICGGGVFLQAEHCRLKAIDGVTGCAFAPSCALGELSPMRIRTVAVGALLKYQRSCEVSSGVALHTIHLGVPA